MPKLHLTNPYKNYPNELEFSSDFKISGKKVCQKCGNKKNIQQFKELSWGRDFYCLDCRESKNDSHPKNQSTEKICASESCNHAGKLQSIHNFYIHKVMNGKTYYEKLCINCRKKVRKSK